MIRIGFSGRRLVIAGVGINGVAMALLAAMLLFAGLLALPRLFSDPFTSAEAKSAVRHFLEWQVYQSGMEELNSRGMKAPDTTTAQRWQEQSGRIKKMEIVSLEIKRPIFHLFSIRPSYIVKVMFRDDNRVLSPRYFTTKYEMVTSESSEQAWYFAF